MIASTLSTSGRVVVAVVALIPLYLTIQHLHEQLTTEGRRILHHPVTILALAYGTAYGHLGDPARTLQTVTIVTIAAYYAFIVSPDIGARYFNPDTVSSIKTQYRNARAPR